MVISQLVTMAIKAVSREHAPRRQIDRIDGAYERIDASQQLTERIDDRVDLKVRRRDLVEHRGKSEKVVAGDSEWRPIV